MPEPTNGEPLSVEGALRTIQDLEGLEMGLYQRTEGVTWMVWGLVTAGLYASFGMARGASATMADWTQFLWAPWIAAGVTATIVLWKTAHLAAHRIPVGPHRYRSMLYFVVYFLVFWVGFFLYHRWGVGNLREPGLIMGLLALAPSLVVFVTPATTNARRMVVAVSVVVVAAAVALAFRTYPSADDAYAVQTVAGAVCVGGGWFLGGLWLTTKG